MNSSNYYELMIRYQTRSKEQSSIKPEETQRWVKSDGKWIVDEIDPPIEYYPLIDRLVSTCDYLEMF